MKKVGMAALSVLLAIVFVMSVYCYGTDKRYSAWHHFDLIVGGFESVPSLFSIADDWNKDQFWVTFPEEADSVWVDISEKNDIEKFFIHCKYAVTEFTAFLYRVVRIVGILFPWNGLLDR